MAFGAAVCPVQYNVGGRHNLYRMGIDVYRVLTGVKRLVPNTFIILFHDVTMSKACTAGILTFGAHKGVHNTYKTNVDVDHLYLLYNGKPRVQVISTRQDYVLLQTLFTAGFYKCHRVLVVTVPGNRAAG